MVCDGLSISLEELRAKEREFSKAARAGEGNQEKPPPELPHAMLVHNDIRPLPGFTGREDLLAGIDAALWGRDGGTAALTNSYAHAAAVKGLGVVGKSMLAR